MKTIELKELEATGGMKLNYKDEMVTILRTPVDRNAGADIEEMRRSIRVLDALDKADGTLELEDADFDYLKSRMLNAKFAMVDPAIVQFVDDVTLTGE